MSNGSTTQLQRTVKHIAFADILHIARNGQEHTKNNQT